MLLKNSIAVVTGGAVRIGREIARSLAASGCHVCIHYRTSEAEAHAAVNEFEALGVRATCVSADLTQPLSAAETVLAHANHTLGPVTILINSAAIFEPDTVHQCTSEGWQRQLTINLMAPFFFTQAFARQLPPQAKAAVLNLIDWRAERPDAQYASYSIAKAGLLAQTRLLAQELAPWVRVNGIAPGAILPAPGASQAEFEQRARDNLLQQTGDPQQIADAALYLLQARFVTGEILHVTGGEEWCRQRP